MQQRRGPLDRGPDFFPDQGIQLRLFRGGKGGAGITGGTPSGHELGQSSLLGYAEEAGWTKALHNDERARVLFWKLGSQRIQGGSCRFGGALNTGGALERHAIRRYPQHMTASATLRSIYQLRAVLRGISPLIWRRVLVRSDATLAHLHAILQILFA
jgi:hypothetical protein